jgi:hypothetical protein
MIGTLAVIIAGWYRHKLAAIGIVVLSFVVTIKGGWSERLYDDAPADYLFEFLTEKVTGLVIAGIIFYFIGSGMRALRDKWRERQAPKEIDVYRRMVSLRSGGEK